MFTRLSSGSTALAARPASAVRGFPHAPTGFRHAPFPGLSPVGSHSFRLALQTRRGFSSRTPQQNQQEPESEKEQEEEETPQPARRRRMKAKFMPYHLMGYAFFTGLAVFTGYLGKWQLDRREWKQKLLDARQQQLDAPPFEITSASQITPDMLHRTVSLVGRFEEPDPEMDYDPTFFVGPRYAPGFARERHTGQIGGSLLTPFVFPDGTRIMVDRGWVRMEERDHLEDPNQTFVGVIQLGEKKPSFMTYESEVVVPGQDLLFVDLQAMHRLSGIPPQSHLLEEAKQIEEAHARQAEYLETQKEREAELKSLLEARTAKDPQDEEAKEQLLKLEAEGLPQSAEAMMAAALATAQGEGEEPLFEPADAHELRQVLDSLPEAEKRELEHMLIEALQPDPKRMGEVDAAHVANLHLLEQGLPPVPNFSSKMLLVHLSSPQPDDHSIVRKPLTEYMKFYTMPETHLVYAGTWFSLSAASLVIMLMRFRRGGLRFF